MPCAHSSLNNADRLLSKTSSCIESSQDDPTPPCEDHVDDAEQWVELLTQNSSAEGMSSFQPVSQEEYTERVAEIELVKDNFSDRKTLTDSQDKLIAQLNDGLENFDRGGYQTALDDFNEIYADDLLDSFQNNITSVEWSQLFQGRIANAKCMVSAVDTGTQLLIEGAIAGIDLNFATSELRREQAKSTFGQSDNLLELINI